MPRLVLFLLVLLVAFIADAPVIAALQNAPDWLPALAAKVTWIGNTSWQAVTLVTLMVCFALARPDPVSARRAQRLLSLVLACFLLILLTGIAVQILKHSFGRPRPDILGDLSPYTFVPFGFTRGWNAFPSGHSTTMGALALLAGRLFPRLWPVAWGIALLVAISRVIVGKHYPSDVVAGLALGAVLAAWLLDHWRTIGAVPRFDRPFRLPRPGIGPISGLVHIPRGIASFFRRRGA